MYTIQLLIALLVASGCGGRSSDDPIGEQEQAAQDFFDWSGKNCLVIVLDALTVRHLAPWGYERQTTPAIDDLATRGTIFLAARSQASSTSASAYSYFTGVYPPLLLRQNSGAESSSIRLPEDVHTFAEAFADAGYATAGFTANPNVTDSLGFDQGFSELNYFPKFRRTESQPGNGTQGSQTIQLNEASTEKMLDAALSWVQTQQAPWLCYLHILRPHNPYRAPDPQGSFFSGDYDGNVDGSPAYWDSVRWRAPEKDNAHLKDFYDGNLRYADALLKSFLDALDDDIGLADTAVIIMSDHGEAFLEHGYSLHNWTVHEELIHVPLIIVPPEGTGTFPATVDAEVQLVDIVPTLADLFGLTIQPGLDGVSLEGALAGVPMRARRVTYTQNLAGNVVGVISEHHKLIVGYRKSGAKWRPLELYDLKNDPMEQNNLVDSRPPALRRLLSLAKKYTATHVFVPPEEPPEISEFDAEVLEALGYL